MDAIDIFRNGSVLTTIKPDDNSTQNKTIMGDNLISVQFRLNRYIDFVINDYCTVFGEVYKINALPIVKELGSNFYEYTMPMHSQAADLAGAQYFFLGDNNTLKETDFSLMGNADVFINLLIENANRVQPGWIKGQVVNTPYKNLTFAKENCYNALGRLATEFDTEFWVEGRTIHLTKRFTEKGYTFRQGFNKGLYEITRVNVDNTSIVTRLYAYGADKNLPADYRNYSTRLRLPSLSGGLLVSNVTVGQGISFNQQALTFSWTAPTATGVTGVTIEFRPLGSSMWTLRAGSYNSGRTILAPKGILEARFTTNFADNTTATTDVITINGTITAPVLVDEDVPFIEKNVDNYGVIEGVQVFDDIYPHRTGKVTGVNVSNPFEFSDTTIDFDVNAQLLPGLTAKVTFNTGQLTGYTFDIASYDNDNKRVFILQNKNETKIEVPSALFRPKIGDEYVFVDMLMPAQYVQAAEKALLKKAQLVLADISAPQITIQAVVDPTYIENRKYTLAIGDMLWIVDDAMGINRKIRITNTVRNIVHEWNYELTLSDVIVPNRIERLLNATETTARDVSSLGRDVSTSDIFNGRLVLPVTTGNGPFAQVVVDVATNKLYRVG